MSIEALKALSHTAIADAFNTASCRKHWTARAAMVGGRGLVFFDEDRGMIQFTYTADDVFLVRFRKAVGTFGDYANAIARGLTSVLSALQAAGLPFVAPKSAEGVEIIIRHNGIGNQVSARYRDPDNFLVDSLD